MNEYTHTNHTFRGLPLWGKPLTSSIPEGSVAPDNTITHDIARQEPWSATLGILKAVTCSSQTVPSWLPFSSTRSPTKRLRWRLPSAGLRRLRRLSRLSRLGSPRSPSSRFLTLTVSPSWRWMHPTWGRDSPVPEDGRGSEGSPLCFLLSPTEPHREKLRHQQPGAVGHQVSVGGVAALAGRDQATLFWSGPTTRTLSTSVWPKD